MLRCFSAVVITFSLFISSTSTAQSGTFSIPQLAPAPLPTDKTTGTPATVNERFDTLTLEGSHLTAATPLIAETDEFPEFTRQLVRVEWRQGDPIDLYIIKPVNVQNPPVVLFLYSFPSDTDRFRNNNYCKTVTKYGFAAVGFVSELTGQRYHDRPMKESFVSELPESLATSVHDVQMILNYLATRGDFDMQHVGMFGQGSGGTIAILAAAADTRLKAVDVLDPWGDWPDWFAGSSILQGHDRTQFLTSQFQESVANLDPVRWLSRLNGRVLRLQNTEFDSLTPVNAKLRIKNALPKGADFMNYDSVDEYQKHAASGGQILSWLGSQLSPSGPLSAKNSRPAH
jgi:Dienelactone hydrolase family